MASPSSYTKRRSPPSTTSAAAPSSVSPTQPRLKPTGGGFFCKSVLFGLFLLALPLFPSQAPDFVGETVLTKFWELIHLLFVGIAVAYGLFSRRNVESSVDLRMSRVDESSLSYVSRIFQVSSVFDEEEELESSCSFVDVRTDESRVSGRASLVVKERNDKAESFVVETELEQSSSSSEYGKINQLQAWNSQYFQGRSKVVVARPAYGLDGHVVHQPLGLPVRSLRSALRDNAAPVPPPPPPPPQDGSFSDSTDDGAVNENGGGDEPLADTGFDEVMAAAPSSPWHSRPESMGMGDDYLSNFQPLSVDETQYATLKSRSSTSSSSSSSSSQASFETNAQNRFSPSRSVSEASLNSNVDESVKEKSLQGSSRSSSPSLPPSPPLSPSPPSPQVATDDTHRRVIHSRHYSDGSLLEEDVRQRYEGELEGSQVRGRRAEFFSKKEPGSKSLNLTAESSRRGKNKSRRSYPPDLISSPVDGADDSTTRRRGLQQKSDDQSFEGNAGKGLESDRKLRVKKGRSHDSLELTAVESAKEEKFSESFPALDVLFQPTNAKASRRAMRSSRGDRDTFPVKDVTRNTVDDSLDYDKSRKKDVHGDNKEVKSNSPRCEPQSWRASSKVSSRGKSVRTIRSDRHGKNLKTDGDTSDDRVEEAKVETRGRTKPRRQWRDELAIVPHQEKLPETHGKSEPEEEDDDVTEENEAEQPQVTLEEEEEAAAWESQSNASHDHYEVDRKADEFIAKFREQIRLQKLHSGEQPRGGGVIGRGGGIGIIRNSHFR